MVKIASVCILGCAAALAVSASVRADEARQTDSPVTLSIQDHRFTPAEVIIPPNVRVEFQVTNHDNTPAEFESDDFSAEKVLPTNEPVKIMVGPLKPGTYEFHDEYHEDVSKGKLIVK